MTALDTTGQAADIQLAIHRRLGPSERFRLAIEMSDAVAELARAGIRFRHPEYTDARVSDALMSMLYGYRKKMP